MEKRQGKNKRRQQRTVISPDSLIRATTMHTLAKIQFRLRREDWENIRSESLWAQPAGQHKFVLKNSPFYAYGVSAEDTVQTKSRKGVFVFERVLCRGGHSTYRILLGGALSVRDSAFLKYWNPIENLGCTFELAKKSWLAVDIPPRTDIQRVYSYLEKAERDGVWSFEEGHCGHPG